MLFFCISVSLPLCFLFLLWLDYRSYRKRFDKWLGRKKKTPRTGERIIFKSDKDYPLIVEQENANPKTK